MKRFLWRVRWAGIVGSAVWCVLLGVACGGDAPSSAADGDRGPGPDPGLPGYGADPGTGFSGAPSPALGPGTVGPGEALAGCAVLDVGCLCDRTFEVLEVCDVDIPRGTRRLCEELDDARFLRGCDEAGLSSEACWGFYARFLDCVASACRGVGECEGIDFDFDGDDNNNRGGPPNNRPGRGDQGG